MNLLRSYPAVRATLATVRFDELFDEPPQAGTMRGASDISVQGAPLPRAKSELQLLPPTALTRCVWNLEHQHRQSQRRAGVPVRPSSAATLQPALPTHASLTASPSRGALPSSPKSGNSWPKFDGERPGSVSAASIISSRLAARCYHQPVYRDEQAKKPDLWSRYAAISPRSAADRQWGLAQHEEVCRLMSRTAHQLDDENHALQRRMADQAAEFLAQIDELNLKLDATCADHREAMQTLGTELEAMRNTLAIAMRSNHDFETKLASSEAGRKELRMELGTLCDTNAQLDAKRRRLEEQMGALARAHEEELRKEREEWALERSRAARAIEDAELLAQSQEQALQAATEQRALLETELVRVADALLKSQKALEEQTDRGALESHIQERCD